MTFGSLFAGIGGMDLGLERAGMECRWQVEIDPYARRVLEKHWPKVRRHDDVRTFPPTDADEWRVDLIAGGFPCQDISLAGKGAGLAGERSGLWHQMLRIICLVRPTFVLVENVAALLGRGMGTVLGGLAQAGFDAEWGIIPACAFGSPHSRERLFCIAHSNEIGRWSWRDSDGPPPRCDHWKATQGKSKWADMELWLRETVPPFYGLSAPPELKRVDEWFPTRLDRVGGCGNAVVPQVAEWIGRRIIEASEKE